MAGKRYEPSSFGSGEALVGLQMGIQKVEAVSLSEGLLYKRHHFGKVCDSLGLQSDNIFMQFPLPQSVRLSEVYPNLV